MTNGSATARAGTPSGNGAHVPLPWLLRRVNQRYRAVISARLAESGLGELPQPGYWALMVLAQGGTEASQLMDELGVSKQAVSKLVAALVSAGFVVRRPNEADRRRTDLLLSAKGRMAARVIEDTVRATEESFVGELGAEPLADLLRLLAQLAKREV